MMRMVLRATRRYGAILLSALAVASCATQRWEASQPSPWSPSRKPDPTTSLATAIPVAVPSGFVLQPPSAGTSGPIDLARAARADGTADARRTLVRDGFVGGYRRQWVKSGHKDENSVLVYKFKTVAGARSYLWYLLPHLLPSTLEPVRFVVRAVPSASGVRASTASRSVAVIAFTSGLYVMRVVASAGPRTNQTAVATELSKVIFFGS